MKTFIIILVLCVPCMAQYRGFSATKVISGGDDIWIKHNNGFHTFNPKDNIGIGVDPTAVSKLTIFSDASSTSQIRLQNNATGSGFSDGFNVGYSTNSVTRCELWLFENDFFRIGTNNSEKIRITAAGDILIGTTISPAAGGGKALLFGDTGTPPTPGSNTAALFADDVAGTVHMFATEEGDGTGTQLSSHNSKGEPIHFSFSAKTGKATYINLVRLAEAVERLTGEQLVFQNEFDPSNPGEARIRMEEIAGDR